jgi:hypothetical protein
MEARRFVRRRGSTFSRQSYIICIKEQSTQQLVKNKINTNVITFFLFCCYRFMFRPLYRVIIRHTVTQMSVLELYQIPIWIPTVFLRVLKYINLVNN